MLDVRVIFAMNQSYTLHSLRLSQQEELRQFMRCRIGSGVLRLDGHRWSHPRLLRRLPGGELKH